MLQSKLCAVTVHCDQFGSNNVVWPHPIFLHFSPQMGRNGENLVLIYPCHFEVLLVEWQNGSVLKYYSAATYCHEIKTAKLVLGLNMCTYYGIWCSHLKSAIVLVNFKGCDAVKVAVVLVRKIYVLPQCENCTIKFYNLTPEGLQSWLFSGLACGPWIFTTLGTYYCIMIWAFHSTALQTPFLSRSNLKDKKLLVFL